MSRHYFRKNYTDFYVWCRRYVRRSYAFSRFYESNKGHDAWLRDNKEDYDEALRIIRQYEVLKASLPGEAVDYLERYLVGNEYREWRRHDPWQKFIFEAWIEVCFPNNHSRIKTIDSVKLGGVLKSLRIKNGYTVSKIAGLLEISETTLRAYESGRTLVKVNILYGLSQIYGVGIDEIINR